jgi:hypothetical protein
VAVFHLSKDAGIIDKIVRGHNIHAFHMSALTYCSSLEKTALNGDLSVDIVIIL